MPIATESSRFPLNEELAGPVTTASPTISSNRISSIDVLRGVALLGILVMNIDLFSNPEIVHAIPVGLPIDTFSGPHIHINLVLLLIKWMFFEGKMRGLFTMLFGAGVILILAFWSGPGVAVKFGPPGRVLATLRGWGNGSVAG
jgi:peptidoglycan/LPS O-acetylase OafA/YrhL